MSGAAAISKRPVRAWFDLARAGNFPSVWSNVLAALVLSSALRDERFAAAELVLALVAGSLMYAGGATLNDVADVRFDSIHRPERALPRRVVTRAAAAWVGALEIALGLGIFFALHASAISGAALALTIVIYDWVHKHWSGAIVLMAGCRVLLALTIASLPGHEMRPAFIGWVAALFIYIVALSWIAKREYRPGAASPKLGKVVGRLLAFIPLVDAIALLVVGAWWPAVACVAAVPLGRWAQRQAAST